MPYDFQAIKSRLTIKDLFEEEGNELKRVGGKLRCLSPFNNEKTPSCYVDEARGRFKCFSSGASGDIFDYIMLTHGCDLPAAMELLAARVGITTDTDWAKLPKPLPRPVRVEETKILSPLCGDGLDRWFEAVEFLATSPTMIEQVATWRGYTAKTVEALAVQGKIGSVLLDPGLRRQDIGSGSRRIAFPVDAMIDGKPRQVAYHVRLKPRPGERKASWRFCPTGVGAWPYVLGNVEFCKLLIVVEGQWDAIAVYDALGIEYQDLWDNKIAIVGMRGAQNWRLFFEHYMLGNLSPEAIEAIVTGKAKRYPQLRCLVICDADDAGESWATPNGDEPCLVQLLQSFCAKVYVREPLEGFGKDVNDVLKTLVAAMSAKEENESQADPDLRT